MVSEKIDFVILWVDETDPNWISNKRQYVPSVQEDASEERYRNWDNLKFFFRGIEKFAPWVNNVYFITCGHTLLQSNILLEVGTSECCRYHGVTNGPEQA